MTEINETGTLLSVSGNTQNPDYPIELLSGDLKIIMLEMFRPDIEDLWFKEELLSDEETMSYNYDYGGCIPFPKEKWNSWYERWLKDDDGRHFYRYLRESDTGGFIGEIAYHYDEELGMYLADIIIHAEYRGKGYGRQGLQLLCTAAKDNGIEVLYDSININNPAIGLFLNNGFIEEYRTADAVFVKKIL